MTQFMILESWCSCLRYLSYGVLVFDISVSNYLSLICESRSFNRIQKNYDYRFTICQNTIDNYFGGNIAVQAIKLAISTSPQNNQNSVPINTKCVWRLYKRFQLKKQPLVQGYIFTEMLRSIPVGLQPLSTMTTKHQEWPSNGVFLSIRWCGYIVPEIASVSTQRTS